MALLAIILFTIFTLAAVAMADADARHHGLGRHGRRTPGAW